MDATAHVVARGGVDALSLRQVASGCGTSTNAVYALFGSRDGLLSAVMMEAVRSFTAEQRAVAETTDALADLLELGRAYRRWALAHPELYAVMFGGRISIGAADDPAERIPEGPLSGMQPIVEVIERGVGTGAMRVRDSVTAAVSIWAGVHGFVSLEIAQWSRSALIERDALYEVHLLAISAHWAA